MQKKRGISLIVLIITIIVMIILAAAIILSLNNNGIIDKANEAVESTNLTQVKQLAALKWSEAYLDEKLRDQEKLEKYVLEELGKEVDLSNYKVTVTEDGVDVVIKIPAKWRKYVVDVVDTVPIPKGFVASPYEGENTKNEGLVIYKLNEGEDAIPVDETEYTSWTTRDQYVWVPVEDFSKFVRISANSSNVLGTDIWEVALDTETNMPLDEQDSRYVTDDTLKEAKAMYESVKEYKGFYIARYEAGVNEHRKTNTELITAPNVYSVMGKIPYTSIPWGTSMSDDTGGAVQVARGIYPITNEKVGVVSTLTYGVQFDAVINWWQERNAVASLTDSTSYSNCQNGGINSQNDLNDGALVLDYSKEELEYVEKENTTGKGWGGFWCLSTGALKRAKVSNIYDMAGNMCEWTMEGSAANGRLLKGSDFILMGYQFPVTSNRKANPTDTYFSYDTKLTYGFRTSLYIKQ